MSDSEKKALNFLKNVIGKPMKYAYKLSDIALYDFGFGEEQEVVIYGDVRRILPEYILHAVCRWGIIWKSNPAENVDTYDEDTPEDEFCNRMEKFLGRCVKRVAIRDNNDLWLDFGDCWMVFATFEDGEESWRFFTPEEKNGIHLVASDKWLKLN